MRMGGAVTVEAFGFNPREGLRRAFVASHHVRTALIDGRPIAMWGLYGPLLAWETYVWLVLAEEAADIPFTVVREARRALAAAASMYDEVIAGVALDDTKAVRFARFLGFTQDSEPEPYGDGYVLRMRYTPKVALQEAA